MQVGRESRTNLRPGRQRSERELYRRGVLIRAVRSNPILETRDHKTGVRPSCCGTFWRFPGKTAVSSLRKPEKRCGRWPRPINHGEKKCHSLAAAPEKEDAARFSLTVNRQQSTIAGMSRGPRQTPGGIVYHVLNRAVARRPLFEKPADYAAFLRVLAEALDKCPMRILACLTIGILSFGRRTTVS